MTNQADKEAYDLARQFGAASDGFEAAHVADLIRSALVHRGDGFLAKVAKELKPTRGRGRPTIIDRGEDQVERAMADLILDGRAESPIAAAMLELDKLPTDQRPKTDDARFVWIDRHRKNFENYRGPYLVMALECRVIQSASPLPERPAGLDREQTIKWLVQGTQALDRVRGELFRKLPPMIQDELANYWAYKKHLPAGDN